MPEVGGGGWAKWVKADKRYKFPVIKLVNPGDDMYSMATTVNKTVLYTWKLLRVDLKSSHHKEKNV